ncbi:pentapeptide repeat-containing protein, partial [Yaniella flava]|uniref:pentapeptide repeat-containing protein n=1 Tax=Yaniella flava TaxID=287930 RepID=UPI0031E2539D
MKVLLFLASGAIVYGLMVLVPWVWATGGSGLEVEERRNFIAVLAGALAVGGLLLTRQRHELSRDENRTNRYSEAVRLLGSRGLTERLGGIYALQRLAKESLHDAPAVAQLLAAFVKESSQDFVERCKSSDQKEQPVSLKRTSSDIEAATRALCRPELHQHIMGAPLTGQGSLEGAYLVGAMLNNLNLNNVDLRGSYLDGASFNSTSMYNVQLRTCANRLGFSFGSGVPSMGGPG